MPELTLFAIRVKGTQKYLPRSQRRDERGGSHLEPVDFTDRASWPERYSKNMMIRTWTTEAAAKSCLNTWLQGKFKASRGGDEYDGYWEEMWVEAQEHRIRDMMEIVPLTLRLAN